MKKRIILTAFMLFIFFLFSLNSFAVESDLPVVVTSAGQGVNFNILENFHEISISTGISSLEFPFDYGIVLTPSELAEGVGIPTLTNAFLSSIERTVETVYKAIGKVIDPNSLRSSVFNSYSGLPVGTKYKTIIIVIDYAGGIDEPVYNYVLTGKYLEDEFKRIEDVLNWSKDNDLKIIGMYWGSDKDVVTPEKHIFELVLPYCEFMVIYENSNLTTMIKEINSQITIREFSSSRYLQITLKTIINF